LASIQRSGALCNGVQTGLGDGWLYRGAAALIDTEACPGGSVADAAPLKVHEIAVPSQNERWVSHEPRNGRGLQRLIAISALSMALGLGWFTGWNLYRYFERPDELSGRAAVDALVDRIIAVESDGDPNAKNNRSSCELSLGCPPGPGRGSWSCEAVEYHWPGADREVGVGQAERRRSDPKQRLGQIGSSLPDR
jgi:hypothetical protein